MDPLFEKLYLESVLTEVSSFQCMEQRGSTVLEHTYVGINVLCHDYLQLSMPKVKKMSLLLDKTRSSYYPAFRTMLESIDAGAWWMIV